MGESRVGASVSAAQGMSWVEPGVDLGEQDLTSERSAGAGPFLRSCRRGHASAVVGRVSREPVCHPAGEVLEADAMVG